MLGLKSRANDLSQEPAMSDTYRRYCAIKAALRQVIAVKPDSHAKKHLNTLTGLICGIVGSHHTQLPKVVDQAPSHGAKRESRLKRFKRWLCQPNVTYETYFLPFAQALLTALAQRPLVLIMDGSTVGHECQALLLNVVYGGRALPLAWTVVSGPKGHFTEATHCALLAQVQPLIPSEASVTFVGDGEFDGTTLLATLQDYGWHYVCRTATHVLLWTQSACLHIGQLLSTANDAVYLLDVRITDKRFGPLMALGLWEADQKAPIFLVSSLTDPNTAWDRYRQRFQIETFFSDQKSRGFHLHKSHLADPTRLAHLLIAACLAYLWMVYLGVVAVEDGWLTVLHRTTRCDLSLFQIGLVFLAHCLNEDLPILADFIPPAACLFATCLSNTFSVPY
jgi:hypothetical protein